MPPINPVRSPPRLAFATMARAHLYVDAKLRREAVVPSVLRLSLAPRLRAPTLENSHRAAKIGRKIDFVFGSQGITLFEQSDSFHERNPGSPLKWYQFFYRLPLDHIASHGPLAGVEVALLSMFVMPPVLVMAAVSAAVAAGRSSEKDGRLVAAVITAYTVMWGLTYGRGFLMPSMFALSASGSANAYYGLPALGDRCDLRQAALDGGLEAAQFAWIWLVPPAQFLTAGCYALSSGIGLGVKVVLWGVSSALDCACVGIASGFRGYRL